MAVGLKENTDLLPIDGIRLASCTAGIYKKPRPDLVFIECCSGSQAAAVFTKNAFSAAPVQIARQHLKIQSSLNGLLINAGNANAGTGAAGVKAAKLTCEHLAQLKQVPSESILPFSTGVIGELLPAEKICQAMPELINKLDGNGWLDAARAIMTTDTISKAVSRKTCIEDREVSISGMAKGSGMIHPDMATMLAFIATDAVIARPVLQQILERATEKSFNRISVDGDTSTNDACVLMATARSGNRSITRIDDPAVQDFITTLEQVCLELAHAIVRDGEGATKFVTLDIMNGRNINECKQAATAIAHSPLIKTALFASDPNWGRILAAVGRAGLDNLDVNRIEIYIDNVCIVRNGSRDPDYTEKQGQAVFSRPEITLHINLNRGNETLQFWTCDFSYDYVRINADYRT